MGTRHLIAVQLDGEYKLAQYGQWDGYPSGQGVSILRFLKSLNSNGLERFKQSLRQCRFLEQDEIHDRWIEAGADESGFVSMAIAEQFKAAHPQLSRDTSAEVLQLIMEAPAGLGLQNSINFAGDSLFCEWAYVVDLDRGLFEVYQGFNTEPVPPEERFFGYEQDVDRPTIDNEYSAVKFKQSWPLDALPEEADFVLSLEHEE